MPLYKLEMQARRPEVVDVPANENADVFGPFLVEATDEAAARQLIGLNYMRTVAGHPASAAGFGDPLRLVSTCFEVAASADAIAATTIPGARRIWESLALGDERSARLIWWPTAPWQHCPV